MICPHCKKDTDKAPAGPHAGRFAQWWELYPLKKAKKDALKAWSKEADSDIQAYVMIEGLKSQLPGMLKNPKYIPYPATWIRGRRWEDEQAGIAKVAPKRTIACELCGDTGLVYDETWGNVNYSRCSCDRGALPGLVIPQAEADDPGLFVPPEDAPF